MALQSSMVSSLDIVHAKARDVTYPYLLVMADKDVIVNNKSSKEWHAKTSSKVKQLRLMAGAYHELSKEPNNHVLFEAALKFMGERLTDKTTNQVFGTFDLKKVKYLPKPRPLLKRRKFWFFLLVWAYLAVGFILALIRGKKRMLVAWPRMLKH